MENAIHIYTSSKGGVGKTLQAICTSLYYLKRGLQVYICDFNNFNADLKELLNGLTDHDSTQKVINKDGLTFRPLKGNSQSYLVGLTQVYSLFEDGIGGFFRLLNGVFDFCNDKKHVPQAIIIDTGLHFANFNNFDSLVTQDPLPELAEMYRPYFWFVWTIAAIARDEEMAAIVDTIETLKSPKINIGWKKNFTDVNNFIHVINPHAFLQPVNLGKFLKKLIVGSLNVRTIESLLTISNLPKISIGLTVNYIIENVKASIKGEDIDRRFGTQLVKEEFFDNFAKPILKEKRKNFNLFVIPYFDESLAGYTDAFAYDKNLQVDELIQKIGPVYNKIVDNLEGLP